MTSRRGFGMCLSPTTGGDGDVSCWGATASLRCSPMCCSSASGGGAGVSCGGAATSLRCVGICRSSATRVSAGGSFCGPPGSVCRGGPPWGGGEERLAVTTLSRGAPSAADGTATAFDAGEAATQGMPRRDKQLRSSCHQSCCWHAAGGSEISALATSSSSRTSGYNASTPTTLANATREADATKRKFEYKAHLLRT